MSIQSEIDRIKNNIASAYTQVNAKLQSPLASNFTKNSANLASAIAEIPKASEQLKVVNTSFTGKGTNGEYDQDIIFSGMTDIYIIMISGPTRSSDSSGYNNTFFDVAIWVKGSSYLVGGAPGHISYSYLSPKEYKISKKTDSKYTITFSISQSNYGDFYTREGFGLSGLKYYAVAVGY